MGAGLPTGSYYLLTTNSAGYVDELHDDVVCPSFLMPKEGIGLAVRRVPMPNCSLSSGTTVALTVGVTTSVDFALALGGRASGVVTGAGGGVLAGVKIDVFGPAGQWVVAGETDVNGFYHTPTVPAGSYYLRTTNSGGWADELFNNIPCPNGSCSVTSGTAVGVSVGTTAGGISLELTPQADLSVTLTDAPDPVSSLGTITYTIAVANLGPSAASSVTVVQTLPAGVSFSSATGTGWSCGAGGGTVTCTRPSLAVGAAPAIAVQVTAGSAAASHVSSASVSAAEADPNLVNNSESETTTVNGPPALLTVFHDGTGSGSVTSSPGGIDCGTDCSQAYDYNTVVTLTATADAGSVFSGWSGDCSGVANPFGITMDAAKSCTATFVPAPVILGTRTKTVSGSFNINGAIAYTIILTNTGTATQADNAGHELADALPSSLTLVSASCTAGGTLDLTNNTVSWDGSLPSGGSVTITISATVKPTVALRATISNQATIAYDANVDGTNESTALTDDPSVAGSNDPTAFVVVSPSMDFYTLTPCRLLDTRNAVGTYGGPALAAGAERVFPLLGRCGIPATARAVSVNLTVTQSTTAGNLRLYPAGTPLPTVSSINYILGLIRANNAVVGLNGLGELAVRCSQASGTVHFILDVNGYFE